MPKASPDPATYTHRGHYSTGNLLFEHSILHGQLLSTKIFHFNGQIMHEISLSPTSILSFKDYSQTGNLKLSTHFSDPPEHLNCNIFWEQAFVFFGRIKCFPKI